VILILSGTPFARYEGQIY